MTAPVTGQMESGEPISGIASAGLDGKGTVRVEGAGFECNGTYNAFSEAPILTIPLVCSNGLTALAQVNRSEDLMSGNGDFELSDGRVGKFEFAVQ